ncbi:uncharacterized protein VICG_00831 [Vittaforma corneae ATCC 50505]|uniref:Elongin-C n=1 Tax=Vittaforma corneae (strain ATCC 50505) TaxID=993615 RepID=L2GMR4_VITCO|nr:uncharacterized protein VICG_00831 [Vittaforma corneae ATCC 50505]ELA42188.1 hypothetical protein VICG_00831 [Vittaforma corneae ATCC 50505]
MENYVKLISSDSVEFVVETELVKHSRTLAVFLDDRYPFIQSQTKEVRLPIRSKHLKRILEFMHFIHKRKSGNNMEFKINDEETMDLLEIASYLRI